MISEQRQQVLATIVGSLLQTHVDARNYVDGVRGASTWGSIVPTEAAYISQLRAVIRAADAGGWLQDLVSPLATRNPGAVELALLLEEIKQSFPPPATINPAYDDVWLAADRPFVNRRNFRQMLMDITSTGGAPLLLIDGASKTGKSYSFWLINHMAPAKGFEAHKFSVASCLRPNELAAEVLDRIGSPADLQPIGNESAERWAEKLATVVYNKLKDGPRRVLVFDDFPVTTLANGTILGVPLPDGTASFLIRLATYADQELGGKLRIVFMRFETQLPNELEDVALRDEAQIFTKEDMVEAIMQLVDSRKWSVSKAAIKDKVDEFHQKPERTLNERFRFVQGLLRQLGA
ncbi:UNVERIFIED_ORG: hypothetical protein GGE44_001088 [Rhizobium esperanzae]